MSMTIEQIMTQARYRADMENSTFVSDTELITYINKSLNELWDILVASYGDDYFVSSVDDVTDGNAEISLPATFYKLTGVDMEVDGQKYALAPFSWAERNKYKESGDALVAGIPRFRYRILDDNLILYPAPAAGYTVTTWYVPRMTDLTAGQSTESTIVDSWIEYVIIDVAIKMLLKEESDVTGHLQSKADVVSRIAQLSKNRDIGGAEVEQDVGTTLFNLRIQTRQRANVLTDLDITDTETNTYINQSMWELYDVLISVYGNEYFVDGYEFTTEISDGNYALPPDFHILAGIDMVSPSDGITYSLQKYNFAERNVYKNSGITITESVPRYRYRLMNNNLRFEPSPLTELPVTIWYIPQLDKLTVDTSTLDDRLVDSWSEFIIVSAAAKILQKKGGDSAGMLAQKQEILQRIAVVAANLSIDKPEVTQDTDPTLFNLRIQSRYRANITDSELVTDTELNHYINNSLGELYDLLIKSYGNDYFVDGYEFSTIAGQEQYVLPDSFYKLSGVDINIGSDVYTMDKFNFAERNVFKGSSIVTRAGGPYTQYRLVGNNIMLLPIPDSAYTVKLWYAPVLTKLTLDTDSVENQVIESWLEYVIIDTAIKVLIKVGGDISSLGALKMAVIERISNMAENRDWGTAECITDIYNINGSGWDI